MQKFIIWLKVNWLKILLILIFAALLSGLVTFIILTFHGFRSLESFSKRQMAGQMALYLPMMFFAQLLTLPFIFAMYYYIMTGKGLGTFRRTKIDAVNVKWEDIIGIDEAKKDAMEVVKLLKDHAQQKDAKGSIIKGTLLIGPPGCGKTYLAKAMATECGLPMISAVGSEFVAMFMGQGAARMKSLFKQARELAKIHGGCIIFIDEIDAFARQRQTAKQIPSYSMADTSYNATINQFLTEMDGLRNADKNVIVIAATNMNEEEIDPAILRSGRFDRKIYVEKPNARERAALLKYYLSKVKYDPVINIEAFAEKAKWFSASDINNLVREANVIAMRESSATISQNNLDVALRRIISSLEKVGGDKILGERVNVPWENVIGMEGAKKEAWEVVELLKDRIKLQAVGGKIIKGVIFLGPPGCGKTYLAKAMATESGFPFISRTGSDFVRMWVGEGARKVEETFSEARKLARAEGGCIIFIDEIDAFAFPRVLDQGFGGTASMNAAINQLLTEMDGLRHEENNIFVLAATNAPENMLDPALMRAGRFDRKIYIALPNLEERKSLFKFYLSRVKTDHSCDPDLLARKTLYFSPSQIDSMIREAGIFALREKRGVLTYKDLSAAYDRIQYGDKSNILMTEKEKVWTAYHEAGHAIIGYLLHPTDDVIKATIIPRKGNLGMVSSRPIEETHSANKEKLLADIKVGVAAYAAEKIKFGLTGSGVGGGRGSDFYNAMSIARHMVLSLGMGKSGLVGDFLSVQSYQGTLNVSEKTKETLDEDIQNILQSCIKEVENTLLEHRDLFERFAQELLRRQELEYDEITAIFNQFGLKPLSREQA
ncbi:MAG TPA: AAA family ATPase [Candidatus Omnitrophota bacterium]|nr:AAA family ATPase [Candidatus Omnitrophota bacterium]HPD84400.1 AAA family ATPase [Candidatus Omnitrophota bacterium]HRZ03258.1 AAA family ATPase [Candidatus Omnitrophota bacterium]